MDPVSKKRKLVIVLAALALLLPLFMMSSLGLGILENMAINHAPAEWAASLDLGVGDFYGVTLRPGSQKRVCERFLETFTTHPKRGYAKYTIATCIERDLDKSRASARDAYYEFLEQYGQDPNSQEYVKEAERAILRLKN